MEDTKNRTIAKNAQGSKSEQFQKNYKRYRVPTPLKITELCPSSETRIIGY